MTTKHGEIQNDMQTSYSKEET